MAVPTFAQRPHDPLGALEGLEFDLGVLERDKLATAWQVGSVLQLATSETKRPRAGCRLTANRPSCMMKPSPKSQILLTLLIEAKIVSLNGSPQRCRNFECNPSNLTLNSLELGSAKQSARFQN